MALSIGPGMGERDASEPLYCVQKDSGDAHNGSEGDAPVSESGADSSGFRPPLERRVGGTGRATFRGMTSGGSLALVQAAAELGV